MEQKCASCHVALMDTAPQAQEAVVGMGFNILMGILLCLMLLGCALMFKALKSGKAQPR